MWKVIRMRLNLRALIEHKPLPRPKSHGGRGGVHKGGNIWGTVTSGHCHKDNISEGETYHFLLWPSDMLQDHRGWCHCTEHDFLLMFYSKFGHISYCWLQSILCWNDLAGRPWPLSDSEGQSRSPPKWSHLETGPRSTFGKNNCLPWGTEGVFHWAFSGGSLAMHESPADRRYFSQWNARRRFPGRSMVDRTPLHNYSRQLSFYKHFYQTYTE